MAKDLDKFQTERLILRGINESDATEIVEWRSDPEVYKYFKSPHKITIQEHFNWFNNSYFFNQDRMDWMCIEKGTGKKIGVFGVAIDGDIVELNYLLAPDAQHKGYATEAIRAIILHAKEKWPEKKMIAEIHKDNEASSRLIEKQGFQYSSADGNFVIYARPEGTI